MQRSLKVSSGHTTDKVQAGLLAYFSLLVFPLPPPRKFSLDAFVSVETFGLVIVLWSVLSYFCKQIENLGLQMFF